MTSKTGAIVNPDRKGLPHIFGRLTPSETGPRRLVEKGEYPRVFYNTILRPWATQSCIGLLVIIASIEVGDDGGCGVAQRLHA